MPHKLDKTDALHTIVKTLQSRADGEMKKVFALLLPLGIFLLAGCSAAGGASSQSGPVTSADDILGAWHRTSGAQWYIAFHEDGTINGSAYLDAVVGGRGHDEWKYRFEGTQLVMEGTGGHCEASDVGIFEVHVLENGNLRFLSIEDKCASRAGQLSGRPDDGIAREYEPVP